MLIYDRVSWEGLLAAGTGAVLVGILTITVRQTANRIGRCDRCPRHRGNAAQQNVLAAEHVAHLGGELFSRHLIAVEVAGTLLLVALVGAMAIVGAA